MEIGREVAERGVNKDGGELSSINDGSDDGVRPSQKSERKKLDIRTRPGERGEVRLVFLLRTVKLT